MYLTGKYGHSRTASCGCGWDNRIHGNICPEHGLPALVDESSSSSREDSAVEHLSMAIAHLRQLDGAEIEGVRQRLDAMRRDAKARTAEPR